MPKCPPSEMAVRSLKNLSEAYGELVQAASRQEQAGELTEAQKRRCWRRAERLGRVIDCLLAEWEQQTCPALLYSCAWEQCERNLAVLNALTPCSQWDLPQLAAIWASQGDKSE